MSASANPTTTNGYRLLYSLTGGKDGFLPVADLLAFNGKLYGTTAYGGHLACLDGYGCGTVFEAGPNGSHHVLHAFSGASGDGCIPEAGLIEVSGVLYGTTSGCGATTDSYGTVYRISTSGQEKIVYSFSYDDAREPFGDLVENNGILYGTTRYGGYSGCYISATCGSVFATTLSGKEKVLHYFGPSYQKDGVRPLVGLTFVKAELYGATTYGGAGSVGTIFKISTTGKEHVLYSFEGHHDGYFPEGQLLLHNGELFGTTVAGGAYGLGTVYAISPSGKERVIYAFRGSPKDGAAPLGRLTMLKGELYGVTIVGGAHQCLASGSGCGTVFKVSVSGNESLLYSFAGGKDGAYPHAGLVQLGNTLYGTTEYGGSQNCAASSGTPGGCGTIFSIAPQ